MSKGQPAAQLRTGVMCGVSGCRRHAQMPLKPSPSTGATTCFASCRTKFPYGKQKRKSAQPAKRHQLSAPQVDEPWVDSPVEEQASDDERVNHTQSTSYGAAVEFQRDSAAKKRTPSTSHRTGARPLTFTSPKPKATRFAVGKIIRDTVF